MSDNVDWAEVIMFRPPGPRYLLAGMLVLGAVFGTVSEIVLAPTAGIWGSVVDAMISALFFYVVPAVAAGELTGRLAGITRNWTYVMAILDQIVLFLFTLVIPFADSVGVAWQIFWLGLATLYLINLLMTILALGASRLPLSLAYSAIFPGLVLLSFHLFIGRMIGIPGTLYLQNSVLFVVSGVLLLITFGLYTVILKANTDLTIGEFFSTLILDEEHKLDGNIRADVVHQVLELDGGEFHFNVPWIHPGPVEGFGGGRITAHLIDEDAFFLHVPSYHTFDLADPDDMDLFLDLPEVEGGGEASEMVRLDRGGFTFYGRRYPGGTAVFIQNHDLDDYDPVISYRLKEEFPRLMLVDLHNQPLDIEPETWIEAGDNRSAAIRDGVAEVVDRLDDAEMHDYSAGVAREGDYVALVEEVNGQRTSLLGVNSNGAPLALHDVADELDHDHALTFTTDAHEEVLELANPPRPDPGDLRDLVAAAEDDLSPVTVGIGERTVPDVELMGKEYEGLITTMNLMARLVPISLFLYYIAIIFLVM